MSDEVKLTWGKTENDLLQRWPKSADGTPEEPALLTVAMDTNAETDMLCAMLRSYDIPVLRKYEGDGAFGKVVLGTCPAAARGSMCRPRCLRTQKI